MTKEKPSIPKGTRDFGPEQMQKRQYIFQHIRAVFEKYGFQPLETPTMENLSVLTGKYGDEGDQLLFRILNSGDFLKKTTEQDYNQGYKQLTTIIAEKGLRYDLTVPFARYVVMNRGTLTFPFKRYQIQPVWRADRPQKGRYREFYQCDADVVGTDSLLCEAEIIGMLNEVFQALGIEGYSIKINNRKVLAGIAEAVGAADKQSELCVAIDKLDKIGQEKVNEELVERGFTAEQVVQLTPLLQNEGNTSTLLAQMKANLVSSPQGIKGVEEVEEVLQMCQKMGVSTENVAFDVTLARGLSYYTGAIFEVKATEVQIGSISGGGRYDNLTGVFGFEGMSGVGISFGVDRIYDVMEELSLFPQAATGSTEVLFVQFDEAGKDYCLPLLHQLRQADIKTELYPDTAKLKKQMNYANQKNIPFVVLVGSNEIDQNCVTLKNMQSGEQELVQKERLVEHLQALLH